MSGWHEGPMLALDTETTSVDPHTCRIVQVALCRILPGEGPVQHLWLLDPGCEIPEGAAAIHGISTERARAEGKPPADVLRLVRDEIVTWLEQGRPLVVMNAAYDITLLEAELARHDLDTITALLGQPIAPVIDPFVLDKYVDPRRRGKRRLENLCEHYRVRIDGAHDAGHDAMAAARVAWRIGRTYPQVGQMRLRALHDDQVEWAAQQADSLRAYFDRQGIAHDGVDGTWPLRRAPEQVPA